MTNQSRFASALGVDAKTIPLLWVVTISLMVIAFSATYLLTQESIGEVEAKSIQSSIGSGEPVFLTSIEPQVDAETVVEEPTTEKLIQKTIREFVNEHPEAEFGITVAAIDGSFDYSHQPNKVFDSASLYKTLAAYRVLQRAENNELNLSSYETCIEQAIIVSDNPCGISLQNAATTSNLDSLLNSWGMTKTVLAGYFPSTTSSDQAVLYRDIFEGKRINNANQEFLLEQLADQRVVNRLAEYPSGTKTYHKTGDIYTTVNSATIVEGDTSYVIIFLSDGWNMSLLDRYEAIKDLHQKVHKVIDDKTP